MTKPASLLALPALMCMTLRMISATAFVTAFPTSSHALRLFSDLPLLQMSGGKSDNNDTHANQLNPSNSKCAGSRGVIWRSGRTAIGDGPEG
jgi:hypothetical protein